MREFYVIILLPLFAKRLIEPELLDHLAPEQARANLRDLVRLNKGFGGHLTIRKMFEKTVNGNDRFSVLDVGAASGDTARLINQLYPVASVTNLDLNAVNLSAAPADKLIGDAFELPFGPESFDYVFSSLFLHHFPDEQVVRLLEEFYQVAKRALLICDLERNAISYWFLPVTKALLNWDRVTVDDGMKSIRASFRPEELLRLARQAGIKNAEVEVFRPAFRLSLVAQKQHVDS
jgi:ubiquinone/menaquinone biosynthesis C-methylase UbiE